MSEEDKLPEEVKELKKSLEDILNVDFKVKRKKKTELDIQKDLFFKIIISLEKLNMRSNVLNTDLDIDLTKYDETFYDVLDNLLILHFGKNIAEIIFFYVYDRIDQDGNIASLSDMGGNKIVLENIHDLWHLIQNIDKLQKQNK
jgi:hypothetical protein